MIKKKIFYVSIYFKSNPDREDVEISDPGDVMKAHTQLVSAGCGREKGFPGMGPSWEEC